MGTDPENASSCSEHRCPLELICCVDHPLLILPPRRAAVKQVTETAQIYPIHSQPCELQRITAAGVPSPRSPGRILRGQVRIDRMRSNLVLILTTYYLCTAIETHTCDPILGGFLVRLASKLLFKEKLLFAGKIIGLNGAPRVWAENIYISGTKY